ncbi:MAG: phosphohydrolase [Omnitrophica bacterium RIFCSPLOWO2_12_FULL_44_17]|uniref:Phosphohydrolase n=1 Tax=Candidatus Danuiimicrobium aquiferis TaxID=1801832 RepID=A0A1G1KYL2_9BACT|nr:MAG: phosphohydrolase [Omnitrophica bacterium RIFCSPHIGHO2_02_FULL_45_28]OGW90385.1 MAG: phosphohydrolase [Omnitrophica bacterium RIFCSPHIGHO2_12_FULL_44_12]OGW98006.1 MAG: phosphohydrolase [Omnitrophica bacterium RIFCSPLOWO2_12_FULL_44_17]OGX03549.1 MAG: phosphohydrolase [Omnitrophica bacterium RIFCSPLOWO2_02_FULL_44_11]
MAEQAEKIAIQIIEKLKAAGFVAFFAGGYVRDLIMGNTPKDYDIATSALPDDIEAMFPKCISVGKKFGVEIVVLEGYQFEVTTFRSDAKYVDGRHPESVSFSSPEEDAKRRDFAINGLFYDPMNRRMIDFVSGQMDIEKKVIRTIGNPQERFEEDHLRILRAIRFAANLNFEIEAATWAAMIRNRTSIHRVSQERIRDELVKMFTRPGAGKGLVLLSESGLLAEVLPEIEALKGVKQPEAYHPEGDVFVHTKLMLDQLKQPVSVELAFSAIFHDVGKPGTFGRTETGDIHFYNHAAVGADIAREALTRLRFSNQEIDRITWAIGNHMRYGDVKEMRIGKLKQLIGKETFEMELELHRADCLASHGSLDNYYFLIQKREEFKKEDLKPKCIINGHDLMALGVSEGPIMKEILNAIYELQLELKFKSKEDAILYVKEKLINQ